MGRTPAVKRKQARKEPAPAPQEVPQHNPLDILTPEARAMVLLEDHFVLCRKYGVLDWEGSIPGTGNLVKFKLASQLASDPTSVAPSSPPVGAAQPEGPAKGPKKRGADGLDAEMQEELLGRVMDAER